MAMGPLSSMLDSITPRPVETGGGGARMMTGPGIDSELKRRFMVESARADSPLSDLVSGIDLRLKQAATRGQVGDAEGAGAILEEVDRWVDSHTDLLADFGSMDTADGDYQALADKARGYVQRTYRAAQINMPVTDPMSGQTVMVPFTLADLADPERSPTAKGFKKRRFKEIGYSDKAADLIASGGAFSSLTAVPSNDPETMRANMVAANSIADVIGDFGSAFTGGDGTPDAARVGRVSQALRALRGATSPETFAKMSGLVRRMAGGDSATADGVEKAVEMVSSCKRAFISPMVAVNEKGEKVMQDDPVGVMDSGFAGLFSKVVPVMVGRNLDVSSDLTKVVFQKAGDVVNQLRGVGYYLPGKDNPREMSDFIEDVLDRSQYAGWDQAPRSRTMRLFRMFQDMSATRDSASLPIDIFGAQAGAKGGPANIGIGKSALAMVVTQAAFRNMAAAAMADTDPDTSNVAKFAAEEVRRQFDCANDKDTVSMLEKVCGSYLESLREGNGVRIDDTFAEVYRRNDLSDGAKLAMAKLKAKLERPGLDARLTALVQDQLAGAKLPSDLHTVALTEMYKRLRGLPPEARTEDGVMEVVKQVVVFLRDRPLVMGTPVKVDGVDVPTVAVAPGQIVAEGERNRMGKELISAAKNLMDRKAAQQNVATVTNLQMRNAANELRDN